MSDSGLSPAPPPGELPPALEGAGPAALLEAVRALRAAVAEEGRAGFRRWRPAIRRPGFAAGALNLAHYLALRRRGLWPLQRGLMRHGLSSLGRLEGRVLATLDAVAGALAPLAGEGAPGRAWPPPLRRFFRGEARLRAEAAALFGPAPAGREGRILVTLPAEAAEDPAWLLGLARRGLDAVRINCAHDDAAAWAAMAAHARAAARAVGRPIPVLMDLAGPKLRTGAVHPPEGAARLRPGDALLLRPDPPRVGPADPPFQAQCLPPEVLRRLRPGAAFAYDDGKAAGMVEAAHPDGTVLVRIERGRLKGARLRPEKGLNFPGTPLGLDPLTPKDLADLDMVARLADIVGYSFVQGPADIARLQEELAVRRPADWRQIGLLAKIETLQAVRDLPGIIVRAAGSQPFGVMIARGDLAVEIGFARLAEMQEEILWLCEAAHIPVVWATQVLEALVKTGLPTRGEMTDAAMAARAECVMLNKGPNIAAAIEALDGLLRRMAEHQAKKTPRLRALRSWAEAPGGA
jgi:pyruvate kinase